MINEALVNAWREAALSLGLSVETGVAVELEPGQVEVFEVLVHDFGRAAGTLVTTTDRMSLWHRSGSAPYFCSALNPLHYSAFQSERFVETLRAWGWCGQGDPPQWYSVEPAS